MPAFRLFGRQWFISSDDLPLLAPWGAAFHGIWAGVLLWGASVARPAGCAEEVEMNVCIYGVLLSFVLTVVSDVMLTLEGLKGSIFETDLRKNVVPLMYFHVANFVFKVVLTAYASILVFDEDSDCLKDDHHLRRAMEFLNISTWVAIGIVAAFSLLAYSILPTNTVIGWKKRIRCLNLMCCSGLARSSDMERIDDDPLARMAWVLASFFNPMDFSPSDLVVAMILAAYRQEFMRRGAADPRHVAKGTTWLNIRETMDRQPVVPLISVEGIGEQPDAEREAPGGLPPRASDEDVPACDDWPGCPPLSGRSWAGGEYPRRRASRHTGRSALFRRHCSEYEDQGVEFSGRAPVGLRSSWSESEVGNGPGGLRPSPRHPGGDPPPWAHLALLGHAVRQRLGAAQFPRDGSFSQCLEADGRSRSFSGRAPSAATSGGSHSQRTPRVGEHEPGTQSGLPASASQTTKSSSAILTPPRLQTVASSASFGTAITWGTSFSGPFVTPPPGLNPASGRAPDAVPLDVLERAAHYHRYSVAVYGALLYLAHNTHARKPLNTAWRCCGLCLRAAPPNGLRQGLTATRSWLSSQDSSRSFGPGAIRNSRVGLRKRLDDQALLQYGLQDGDVLCRSHANSLAGDLPYFVAVDRRYRALVVSIRGTLSLADLVTDFLIKPEPLQAGELQEVGELLESVGGSPRKGREGGEVVSVHSGMLQCARALVGDLEKQGVLECLRAEDATERGNQHPNLNLAGWGLVITGHSLGAGVGSLVALLLRRRYPNVTCWAFSPPGGLMSPVLAEALSPLCTSFVYGKDLVPRLTVGTLERLRDQMVQAVVQCQRSKASILVGGLIGKKWEEEQLFVPAEDVRPQAFVAFQRYKASVESAAALDGLDPARKFIPPGRVIYLRPSKSQRADGKVSRTYQAVWTTGQELVNEGILMSPRLMYNHIPFNSYDTLLEILRTLREEQLQLHQHGQADDMA
ncbi:unnamed protein product [Ostreobium quekettii]|uniref:sn-1-specific diacylglycerol lipase n=1 Tax=Ostreobium quekettii TaxID=121088 RepID=A0A8S1JAP9_9CHLO|nr:unnamed protein product [Ostreobium quekettii]|eukprot:evm.model.scf_194.9 EVM.evm.TU.scf_194.9   scf_194:101122-107867(+)